MSAPLITTKLLIPPPRQGIVPRLALLEIISQGILGKFTLLSAPSGYGKTTLMAEWVSERGGNYPVAWISLDEGDNDPVRFLSYLIAALQNVQGNFGFDFDLMMDETQNSFNQAIVSMLINELSTFQNDFALVLEDYHIIELRKIHQMMVFLLEHLPPQMHLIVLTRADPPFPLARMRARGEMTEIRAKDLRFTYDDAVVLFQNMVGMKLSEENVQILLNRTEGWITGLQLAALSIQGRENPSELISSFGSGHTYIVDYLVEEVLDLQPDNLKLFLLRTSILNRLNGPLCDALTGQSDGEAILEHLVKANLFISRLGDEYRWYRYHRLFADVMANRLHRLFPNQIAGLHLRAAKWFKENNLQSEAIDHAIAAQDYHLAAELVQESAGNLLLEGGNLTLENWMSNLPEKVIWEYPKLTLYHIWANGENFQDQEIEQYLIIAEERSQITYEYDELRGEFPAIRAHRAARKGDYKTAFEQANQALKWLPEGNFSTRVGMHFILGRVYSKWNDIPSALTELEKASLLGELMGNLSAAVSALSSIGTILVQNENPTEAEKVYFRAKKLATGPSGNYLPIASTVFGRLAHFYIDKDDLENARFYAQQTVELGKKWINGDSQVDGLLALARIAHLENEPDKVNHFLAQAKQIAATSDLVSDANEGILQTEAYLKSSAPGRDIANDLFDSLSEREIEVLRLFAEGFSNQETADKLVISLGTVKAHSSNIYRKLDVRNRAQAIIVARELGLL